MRGSTPASPRLGTHAPRARPPRAIFGVLIAVALLATADAICWLYRPNPPRLPEHFSSLYLDRYTMQFQGGVRPVVVLGDSVLWGYGVPAAQTAVAHLRQHFPNIPFANYAYEAEGPADVDFLLRYLFANDVHPRAVLMDLNTLTYNPFAKGYQRLGRALERRAPIFLQPFDQQRIELADDVANPTLEQKLDGFMEDHWQLYGYRVDIHQFLFGDADAVTALWNHWSHDLRKPQSGEQPAYFGLYDLTPLTLDNIAFAYTQHAFSLLKSKGVPVVAFLPPVNRSLVREYIASPSYDANLQRLQTLGRRYSATVLNLDRLLPQTAFLDNAHPNARGNGSLAQALAPAIGAAIQERDHI